jgi:hypothetical protein
MPLINKKGIESENRTTIGHWSVERRQKGINKPKRGYCFTMEQTSSIYRYTLRRGAFQIYSSFFNISDLNFRTNK